MKILFYSHSSTRFGAPSSLVNLIEGIKKIDRSVEILVILPSHGKLEIDLKNGGIDYKVIPHFKWIYDYELYQRKIKKGFVLGKLWLLAAIMLRCWGNLYHLQRHLKNCSAYKPDLIYVNSSLAPMGALVAHFKKVMLVWHHRETINDKETGYFLDFGIKISSWLFKKSRLHIHPSAYLLKAYAFLERDSKSFVVFNGVFSREFKPVVGSGISNGMTFGMIGRISRQKGQEQVLRSFMELDPKDYKLRFFGKGEASYLEYLKKNFPLVNVSYEGFKERDEIFGQVDVIIVNARNESFGRVVTEAFAYSKIVIALRSGAVPELILDGYNGFLFSTYDELKQILKGIRFKNEELSKYVHNARKSFEDSFSLEQYSGQIYDLIKSVVPANGYNP